MLLLQIRSLPTMHGMKVYEGDKLISTIGTPCIVVPALLLTAALVGSGIGVLAYDATSYEMPEQYQINIGKCL